MAKPKNLTIPESSKSLEAHKLGLARELLDDIELSRLGPEQLLLKASRLARLLDEASTREWIELELRGYPNTESARRYMTMFNRWTDAKAQLGYWKPLASLGAWAAAMQAEISQLRVPDVNVSMSSANPHEWVTGMAGSNVSKAAEPVNSTLNRIQERTTAVAQFREIQSRVMAQVHSFAVDAYHRLAFKRVAESIFRDHQSAVDELLRAHAADVLEKIPAITARLSEGDAEAVSQALNSCRRMVKAFADAIQPPQSNDVEEEGEKYSIGADKVLNRIQYFLSQRCGSKTRRDRMNRNLRAIWERASAGAHSDVTPDEGRTLFLQCYLTLGEVLTATANQGGSKPSSAQAGG